MSTVAVYLYLFTASERKLMGLFDTFRTFCDVCAPHPYLIVHKHTHTHIRYMACSHDPWKSMCLLHLRPGPLKRSKYLHYIFIISGGISIVNWGEQVLCENISVMKNYPRGDSPSVLFWMSSCREAGSLISQKHYLFNKTTTFFPPHPCMC